MDLVCRVACPCRRNASSAPVPNAPMAACPATQHAHALHCCALQLTIFKRVCRKLGLQRWPYEKPCKADGERTSGGARAGGTPRGTGSWHLPPVTQAWTGGARAGNHAAAPGGSRASSGQASGQELVAAAAQVGAAACVCVWEKRTRCITQVRCRSAAAEPMSMAFSAMFSCRLRAPFSRTSECALLQFSTWQRSW